MRYIQKLIRLLGRQKKKTGQQSFQGAEHEPSLSCGLEENLKILSAEFRESCDLVVRRFSFGKGGILKAAVVFLDGMANLPMINDDVIKPLMYDSRFLCAEEISSDPDIDELRDRLLSVGDIRTIDTLYQVTDACLSGSAVLLFEGVAKAFNISAKGWDKRAVTEPNTETVVRGPREGFTENLRSNTAMIRRKIRNPALKIHSLEIGKRTRTKVNILYLDDIVNPALVEEVKRRLGNIDTDAILAAGYIEEYIEDSPYSVFPTIWYSEKPDSIAGRLLEGRVVIGVDGTPFMLSVPMLFIENFQTSEDYAIRSYYATMLRILRLMAFTISLFSPAVYVALTTYHQELIPTALLFTMAASSEGVPFPAALEAAIMMFTFEVIREAGVRMPRPAGQAISIVGALVMGQSAVQAGLVGAPIVIVIAITAVSSFVVPMCEDAVSLLRWFLMILSAAMGSFGITLGTLVILFHLASLKSFGTSYLAPIAPVIPPDLKDSVVRTPLWSMRTRPRSLKPQDIKRQTFRTPFDPSVKRRDNRGGTP
jgi:spore germination protein KA